MIDESKLKSLPELQSRKGVNGVPIFPAQGYSGYGSATEQTSNKWFVVHPETSECHYFTSLKAANHFIKTIS